MTDLNLAEARSIRKVASHPKPQAVTGRGQLLQSGEYSGVARATVDVDLGREQPPQRSVRASAHATYEFAASLPATRPKSEHRPRPC